MKSQCLCISYKQKFNKNFSCIEGPSLITLQLLKCLFRFTLRTTWWKALFYILYCCHLHSLPWRHVEIVTLRCNVRGNHVTDSYSVIHLATLCHAAGWRVLKPVTSMLMEKLKTVSKKNERQNDAKFNISWTLVNLFSILTNFQFTEEIDICMYIYWTFYLKKRMGNCTFLYYLFLW